MSILQELAPRFPASSAGQEVCRKGRFACPDGFRTSAKSSLRIPTNFSLDLVDDLVQRSGALVEEVAKDG
jgi:hypothetical protein